MRHAAHGQRQGPLQGHAVVESHTRAHAFYEALGFARHGYSIRVLTDAAITDDAPDLRAPRDE
jgi:hypothetical protein